MAGGRAEGNKELWERWRWAGGRRVQLRGPGSMEVPTGSVRTGEAGGLEALRQLSWRPPRRQLHQTPIARGSLH